MRKSIFFIMLVFLFFFLNSCSMNESLKSSTKEDVYFKNGEERGSSIDFVIVDDDSYNLQAQDSAQAQNDKNKDFKILSIFCDKDKNIVPITIFTEKTISIAQVGLKVTIFSPQIQRKLRDYGLYCILPDDVKVNAISFDNGFAKIDLNEEFYKKKNLNFYLKAITFFLTSFNNVKRVYFMMDGKPYLQSSIERKQKDEAVIFVPQNIEGNVLLIPKWVKIGNVKEDEYIFLSFKQLIESLSYRFSKLKGLKLNYARLKDSTLCIDLTQQLLNMKASAQVDIILQAICFTAREINDNIKQIKLSVNGSFLYLDQYDLNSPIDINQFELNVINIKL